MAVTGITDEILSKCGYPQEKIDEILANPDTDDFRKATSLIRRAYCPIEAEEYKSKYYGKLTPPQGSIFHQMSDVQEIKKIAYVIHASIMHELDEWVDDITNTTKMKKDMTNFLGKPLHSVLKNGEFATDSTGMKYLNRFMNDLMLSTATTANKGSTLEKIKTQPEMLWKWIFKEIEYHEPIKVDLHRILKVAKIVSGVSVTNFRPLVAARLYHDLADLSGNEIIIRDPSCGWLSRMTAAFKIALMYPNKKVKYITTDPNPDLIPKKDELLQILKRSAGFGYANNFEVHFYPQGSEIIESRFSDTFGKMSVVGTSPPYGDTEKYNNMDHSILHSSRYKQDFLLPTLENIRYDLVDNGRCWWNVAPMTTYPTLVEETLEAFEESGFDLINTLKYKVARAPAVRKTGKPDYEPIFIFQRRK